jgi:hypothetical protein
MLALRSATESTGDPCVYTTSLVLTLGRPTESFF